MKREATLDERISVMRETWSETILLLFEAKSLMEIELSIPGEGKGLMREMIDRIIAHDVKLREVFTPEIVGTKGGS